VIAESCIIHDTILWFFFVQRKAKKEHVAVSRSNLFNTSSSQSAPFYFMGEFLRKKSKKKKITYSAISARVITMQCNVDSRM